MSERVLSDWLSGYLEYTKQTEPPTSYHTWTGISLLAGALQRKTHLVWGFEKIYPNLYVILVGPSGRARKGVALGIGKEILKEIKVPLTSESATREALILAMKRSINNYQEPGGAIKFHCSITCFSEELSVFLGQNDIKFLANLTDWYDSKDDWAYETKGTGRDHLQGLCFNLLGATAPDWLQTMLPQEAVGGGFTSRVIFIVEERKSKTVSKHVVTADEEKLKIALLHDLERISTITGPFTFTPEGELAYTSWYEREDAKMQRGEMPIEDPRFAGYCERRTTHARKVAMAISASRGQDRLITSDDFHRTLKIMEAAEKKMYKTFGGLGRAKYSDATEKILTFIQFEQKVSRSSLMKKFYRDVDSGTLKIIEEVLEQMQVVRIERVPASGEVVYIWTGEKRA